MHRAAPLGSTLGVLLPMSDTDSIHLSLLENSHAFLNEAVAKALSATSDIRQWQFAILNLVQSLELSLKAALSAIHPILVYEDIDRPKNSLSSIRALQRLENPKIGGFTFSDRDKVRIRSAIKVRNEVTHSDFDLTGQYAAAKFFEIFAFVSDFQRRHLNTTVADFIPPKDFQQLVQIRKLLEELVSRAKSRIAEEKVNGKFVWACPNCGEDTFVIEDGTDTCYACSHAEPVVECVHCEQLTFETDMESFFEFLDIDHDEGQTFVHNSYGYSNYNACSNCISKIRRDIQGQRAQEEFHRLEEEYHHRNA